MQAYDRAERAQPDGLLRPARPPARRLPGGRAGVGEEDGAAGEFSDSAVSCVTVKMSFEPEGF